MGASMLACTKLVKIAQIESRTQACLSMTEMQAMTQSVHTPSGLTKGQFCEA
jgi:hypothetical protein